jgi:hypothetical protein
MKCSKSRNTAYHRVREAVKSLFASPRLDAERRYNIVASNGEVLLRDCPAPMAEGYLARYNLDDRPAGCGKARAVPLTA